MCTCDMRRQRYHKNHTHHTIYDFVETRVIDLKVFGQGHMLYLHFLKVRRQSFGHSASPAGSQPACTGPLSLLPARAHLSRVSKAAKLKHHLQCSKHAVSWRAMG